MTISNPDWQSIRDQAAEFPEAAFTFVREGLSHTVKLAHGQGCAEAAASGADGSRPRHVTGQQLCVGLRDYAIEKFGMLAGAVMRKWGLKRTEDFGIIVYTMIDRGEMRASPEDTIDDFRGVFDFEEAFGLDAARDVA